jgi:two-component system response regulator YesN
MNIFLVDDEPAALRYLCKAVELTGIPCEVVGTAESGAEALTKIAVLRPDAVLADVRMPIMNGIALVSAIREQYPDILAVIISGYQDFEYARAAMKARVVDYLLKPVGIEPLRGVLQSMSETVNLINARNRERISKDMLLGYEPDEFEIDRYFPDMKQNKMDSPQFFTEMVRYIDNNLAGPITLKTLCCLFSISKTYANQMFRKYAHESFGNFLTKKRIERAKTYLSGDSNMSVKDVAALVGFTDQFYFSKVFRSITGVSPSKYSEDARD